MKIFDRWGTLQFETNDKNEGWNGKIQDKHLGTPENFIYKIYILDINGEEHNIKGNFILVR